jgi:predicted Co/Zn/Cd cation transporter (cation efflux family)
MGNFIRSQIFQNLMGILIGSVWVFHGLYSKISNGIPRHRLIVGRILGEGIADSATFAIGLMEILLGLWAYSGRWRKGCALVQTLAITAMNSLEIYLAKDLLISAPGMVVLNLAFLSLIWYWAFSQHSPKITG